MPVVHCCSFGTFFYCASFSVFRVLFFILELTDRLVLLFILVCCDVYCPLVVLSGFKIHWSFV